MLEIGCVTTKNAEMLQRKGEDFHGFSWITSNTLFVILKIHACMA